MAKKKAKSKNTKNKGGRPTRYKAEYAELAYKLCLLGATDNDMAEIIGVQEKTINNWKKTHKKFLQSLKRGKAEADADVAKSLYKRAIGYKCKDTKFASHEGHITDEREYDKHYPPDPTAAIFWLKNRQPDKWRDKQELEHSGDIKIDIINYGDNPTT